MRITVALPEEKLGDPMQLTGAATAQGAVLTAVMEFNRRCRIAALAEYAGKAESLVTLDDLLVQRRRE